MTDVEPLFADRSWSWDDHARDVEIAAAGIPRGAAVVRRGFPSAEMEAVTNTPSSTNETAGDWPEAEGATGVLLRLAAAARLYRSADGGIHVQVPVADRNETFGLKSAGFRDWLVDGYFAERHEPATPAAIQRVISVLEAQSAVRWCDSFCFCARCARRGSGRFGLFPGPGRCQWKSGQD